MPLALGIAPRCLHPGQTCCRFVANLVDDDHDDDAAVACLLQKFAKHARLTTRVSVTLSRAETHRLTAVLGMQSVPDTETVRAGRSLAASSWKKSSKRLPFMNLWDGSIAAIEARHGISNSLADPNFDHQRTFKLGQQLLSNHCPAAICLSLVALLTSSPGCVLH